MGQSICPPSEYVYAKRPLQTSCPFSAADKNYCLLDFRGVPQNPTFRMDELEKLVTTFEAREGKNADIFICTYPKAGTTWMQQIVHCLMHGGEHPADKSLTIYSTAPWLETLCAAPILWEREANNYTLEQLAAMPTDKPRFFKSHANFPDLPRGGKRGVRAIVVARNPKDVCVSMWHHAREKPEFNKNCTVEEVLSGNPPEEVCPDFEEFVELFVTGKAECGSFFDHTLEWYAASLQDPDSVLFLKYEDMVDDPRKAIAEVAEFIGVGQDPELLEKTAQSTSMKFIKANAEAVGIYAGNVRKGGYGNWRNKFSDKSSALFDKVYKQQMSGTGLTFNFGEGLIM